MEYYLLYHENRFHHIQKPLQCKKVVEPVETWSAKIIFCTSFIDFMFMTGSDSTRVSLFQTEDMGKFWKEKPFG